MNEPLKSQKMHTVAPPPQPSTLVPNLICKNYGIFVLSVDNNSVFVNYNGRQYRADSDQSSVFATNILVPPNFTVVTVNELILSKSGVTLKLF